MQNNWIVYKSIRIYYNTKYYNYNKEQETEHQILTWILNRMQQGW